ncbi:MAG: hypothetical protein IJN34_01315, partial [Clostridia bacterium]|nr:hypothetical protein [Clostridia bacterium]
MGPFPSMRSRRSVKRNENRSNFPGGKIIRYFRFFFLFPAKSPDFAGAPNTPSSTSTKNAHILACFQMVRLFAVGYVFIHLDLAVFFFIVFHAVLRLKLKLRV